MTDQKFEKPVFKKNQPDDSYKFRPLPKPPGNSPYHLSLSDLVPDLNDQQTVFHMVGDTGGIRNPSFQKLVAGEMAKQFLDKNAQPQFLYHLGDVVYHFGEAEQYERQFLEPYQRYPAPIFAIPGNHDSDINPNSKKPYQSLDAFTAVFCDTERRSISFGGKVDWKSMVQPNIYWTLKTPLADIIGVYTNVPKFGVVTDEQKKWFIEELKTADLDRPGKALIVCLHHSPYSADINHGSSEPMIKFLEAAFAEAGVKPDIVFSGHVHNYQRFEKRYPDGITVPFIVSGSGGFDELHPVALKTDERFSGDSALFEDVKLVNYCDTKHGFLKISIVKNKKGLALTGEYYSIPAEVQTSEEIRATLTDTFTLEIY